jgi:hypothetical protein
LVLKNENIEKSQKSLNFFAWMPLDVSLDTLLQFLHQLKNSAKNTKRYISSSCDWTIIIVCVQRRRKLEGGAGDELQKSCLAQ